MAWPEFLIRAAYDLRPTPKVRLTGVRADLDGLEDGSTFAATAMWWNGFLAKRPALIELGAFRPYDRTLTGQLQKTVNSHNRPVFEAIVRDRAPVRPRLAGACLALGYALARTFAAGQGRPPHEPFLSQAPEIDLDAVEHNAVRYSLLADYHMLEQSPGYWREREEDWVAWKWAIAGIRWAYKDQVERWESAEGVALGFGIGFSPLEEGELVTHFADRLFEEGGRLAEVEIRMGAGTLWE